MKTPICNGRAHIDAEAIARGMLAMVEDLPDAESYQTALKFGMLPAPLMEILDKALDAKAEDIAKDHCEKAYGFRPENNVCESGFKRDFIREATRAVCTEMYRQTPMVV